MQKETCRQFLDCHQNKCVMFYQDNSLNCWDVEGTLCFEHSINELKHLITKEFCENCCYYKFRNSIN